MLAAFVCTDAARGQDTLNCSGFPSQAAAQEELRKDPSDPNGLDGSVGRGTTGIPGVACEANPAPKDLEPVPGYGGRGGDAVAQQDAGQGGGGVTPAGRTTTVRITEVIDGDTYDVTPRVAGRDRVRLIGADTPEVFGGAERCGPQASAFSRLQLEGKRVRLELGADPVDPYDRTLAYVRFPGDTLYSATLVRKGLARVLVIEPNDRYEDQLRAAERQAKAANAGIWGSGPCRVGGGGEPSPPVNGDEQDRPIRESRSEEQGDGGGTPGDLLPPTGGTALFPAAALLCGSGALIGIAAYRNRRW